MAVEILPRRVESAPGPKKRTSSLRRRLISGVSATVMAVGGLSIAGSDSPIPPQFPKNFCYLQDFQTSADNAALVNQAKKCEQAQNGEVDLVFFAPVSHKQQEAIARETERIAKDSTGGRFRFTVRPFSASPQALADFEQTSSAKTKGCDPIPPVQNSPAAIAYEDMMPHVKNSTTIVALIPQTGCDHILGNSYPSTTKFANIYLGGVGTDAADRAEVIVHEAGEGINANDAGRIYKPVKPVGFGPFLVQFVSNGKTINLSSFLPNAVYEQYSPLVVPGVWDGTKPDGEFIGYKNIPVDNPLLLAMVGWPERVLHDKNAITIKTVGKGLTTITNEQASENTFAIVSLTSPVTMYNNGTDMKHSKKSTSQIFDRLALIPRDNPQTGKINAVSLVLFNEGDHINAVVGTIKTEGTQSMLLNGGQIIQFNSDDQGISVRTFANISLDKMQKHDNHNRTPVLSYSGK